MDSMKDKRVLIGISAVVVVLLIGGLLFMKLRAHPAPEVTQQEETVVPTVAPSDLGLSFVSRPDKKAVKFTIAKVDGITKIEYFISYKHTDTSGQSEDGGGDISEALYGAVDVKPGQSAIETEYRDLGTCSSGTCRYHTVTSPVTLTLKITKSDGKVYSAEASLSL